MNPLLVILLAAALSPPIRFDFGLPGLTFQVPIRPKLFQSKELRTGKLMVFKLKTALLDMEGLSHVGKPGAKALPLAETLNDQIAQVAKAQKWPVPKNALVDDRPLGGAQSIVGLAKSFPPDGERRIAVRYVRQGVNQWWVILRWRASDKAAEKASLKVLDSARLAGSSGSLIAYCLPVRAGMVYLFRLK